MSTSPDPIGALSGILAGSNQLWRKQSACANPEVDPEIFHAKAKHKDEVKAAKKICNACPVAKQCLTWALETNEPYGICGGLTTGERRSLLRKRRLAIENQNQARLAAKQDRELSAPGLTRVAA